VRPVARLRIRPAGNDPVRPLPDPSPSSNLDSDQGSSSGSRPPLQLLLQPSFGQPAGHPRPVGRPRCTSSRAAPAAERRPADGSRVTCGKLVDRTDGTSSWSSAPADRSQCARLAAASAARRDRLPEQHLLVRLWGVRVLLSACCKAPMIVLKT
jgi:hypothetical protein